MCPCALRFLFCLSVSDVTMLPSTPSVSDSGFQVIGEDAVITYQDPDPGHRIAIPCALTLRPTMTVALSDAEFRLPILTENPSSPSRSAHPLVVRGFAFFVKITSNSRY